MEDKYKSSTEEYHELQDYNAKGLESIPALRDQV